MDFCAVLIGAVLFFFLLMDVIAYARGLPSFIGYLLKK